jgi:hypothetical protein
MKKYKYYIIALLLLSFFVYKFYTCGSIVRSRDINLIKIDCTKRDSLLQLVYDRSKNRAAGISFKQVVEEDCQNLEIAISIIENCGIPKKGELKRHHNIALWLAIQHSSRKTYIKKYFYAIERMYKDSILHGELYALMLDRKLMFEDKPQLYGSQFKGNKLYEVDNIDSVKFRREKMGLEPLDLYLKQNNIKVNN